MRGERGDLSSVLLDMDLVPPFHRRVYEAARGIPQGVTMTYGALAARIGAAGSARAVGQALARNPFAIIVPCHRVVAAGGRTGGFSANGGVMTKSRLLAIDGHEESAAEFSMALGWLPSPVARGKLAPLGPRSGSLAFARQPWPRSGRAARGPN
ncbi:MAG: MGMT family protein [Methylocella sp.]